ncbi:ATP-dependent zinc protease family protein [Vibrio hippocampi]|uniref:Retropepsin-like aspartic endopeptidase domain-containing protein n=1 Tax=Vibrio hippocampi TaxID=654686 RepID=A0ABN8DLF6_9VIBR|nr:ATP-dependent zinc protease [Vibrio hippocampi]CAH0529608.1 hypothetical protein VHP8226_03363 [Vibrio hippocampi]
MNFWKRLLPVAIASALAACSTTQPSNVEVAPQPPEQPVVSQPEMPEVSQPPVVVEPSVTEPAEVEKPVVENKPPKTEPEKPPVVAKPTKTEDGKLILGEEEFVSLVDFKITTKARIDTGATTSSLSAVDIVPFERDGKDWVKFKVKHKGIESKEISLPIKRWVKIKQSSSEESDKRPVIATVIKIGDMDSSTEFTLADRTHLSFPILLGRSFFRDVAVVDVAQKYVQPKP